MNDIKSFNLGDIAYIHRVSKNNNHFVDYGIVTDKYPSIVIVDLLRPKETRYINGIPIDDFHYCGKWNKLPKGWTYNTRLYEVTNVKSEEDKNYHIDLKNPDSIAQAYKDGMLVYASKIFDGIIDVEITKDGYRIIKKYPMFEENPHSLSLSERECYHTYEEAKQSIDDFYAELKRQSELSDYEWSVEQIDRELNSYQRAYKVPDDTIKKYRDWILERDKVEDIEVKISYGILQWKYEKNKKWKDLIL